MRQRDQRLEPGQVDPQLLRELRVRVRRLGASRRGRAALEVRARVSRRPGTAPSPPRPRPPCSRPRAARRSRAPPRPSPTNSSAAFVPPPTPISRETARIRSLPVTNGRFSPVNSTRIVPRHGLPELAEREAVRDVGRAEPGAERAERAVRAGVRVAAGDHRPGDDPALLAEQRVLDPAAALVVERHAVRARPLLQPPLELGRARVLRRHEVVGDHHDLRRVEDLRDAHLLQLPERDRPADVVRHHDVAAHHHDVPGLHIVGVAVREQDLLSERVRHRAPPGARPPRRPRRRRRTSCRCRTGSPRARRGCGRRPPRAARPAR